MPVDESRAIKLNRLEYLFSSLCIPWDAEFYCTASVETLDEQTNYWQSRYDALDVERELLRRKNAYPYSLEYGVGGGFWASKHRDTMAHGGH